MHMIGQKLNSTNSKISQAFIVDKIDDFMTYNPDFFTDGTIEIKGNRRMEFHVSGATYLYFAKNEVFLFTQKCIKEIKGLTDLKSKIKEEI